MGPTEPDPAARTAGAPNPSMADRIGERRAVDRRMEGMTIASPPPVGQSFRTLLRRLSKAGFAKNFVRQAILPDWWDDQCADDPSLVQDVEIRVARFLGLSMSVVGDPRGTLDPPQYPDAQLRRIRDTDRARLAPAMHAAMRIAAAVVRNLHDTAPAPRIPPREGLEWRDEITGTRSATPLTAVAGRLWKLGIPIVPLDLLPAPGFQGMACIVEDRPVILLGHRHDARRQLGGFLNRYVDFAGAAETDRLLLRCTHGAWGRP